MDKVVDIIKRVAPEFKDLEDTDIKAWIELAEPFVSKSVFGKLYHQALAYFTAHLMKITGYGDTSNGTVGDSLRVASVSEGNTSVSFNTSLYASDKADSELNLTIYGMNYKRIRSMCVIPVISAGVLNGRS